MTSTDLERRNAGQGVQLGAGPMTGQEYKAIEWQAIALAQAAIVPASYRNKPANIIAAAAMGRDLGLSVMASLRMLHVIEGKPSMSAELMSAMIRARGHSLTVSTFTDEHVVLEGKRGDTGDAMTVEWTKAHTEAAGLAAKDNWLKYWRSMALARCTSQLGRALFADVLMGISYVPEEIGGDDVEVVEGVEVEAAPFVPAVAATAPKVDEVEAVVAEVVDDYPTPAGDVAPDAVPATTTTAPTPAMTGDNVPSGETHAGLNAQQAAAMEETHVGGDETQQSLAEFDAAVAATEPAVEAPAPAAQPERAAEWWANLPLYSAKAYTVTMASNAPESPLSADVTFHLCAVMVAAGYAADSAEAMNKANGVLKSKGAQVNEWAYKQIRLMLAQPKLGSVVQAEQDGAQA